MMHFVCITLIFWPLTLRHLFCLRADLATEWKHADNNTKHALVK